MKFFVLLFVFVFSASATASNSEIVPAMTPDELPYYHFTEQQKAKPPVVGTLSATQQDWLDRERKEIKGIIARRLGVSSLPSDTTTLDTIQRLIDQHVLENSQEQQWQQVGVIFGDILAAQFKLHWVSYEDEAGASTVLQYKDTQNFVFPVTVFSKRVKLDQKLDVHAIYNDIGKQIKDFIAYENRNLPGQ